MAQGEAICPLGTQRSPRHRSACGWSSPTTPGVEGHLPAAYTISPALGKECWAGGGGRGFSP